MEAVAMWSGDMEVSRGVVLSRSDVDASGGGCGEAMLWCWWMAT